MYGLINVDHALSINNDNQHETKMAESLISSISCLVKNSLDLELTISLVSLFSFFTVNVRRCQGVSNHLIWETRHSGNRIKGCFYQYWVLFNFNTSIKDENIFFS